MVERNPGAQPPHRGPERRGGVERRNGEERREEIRWEPQKEDRRSGKDRRRHGGWDDTPIR
ncbi:hypothetical protein BH23PSE2_BH23PSE2_04060 [soil metagenome]